MEPLPHSPLFSVLGDLFLGDSDVTEFGAVISCPGSSAGPVVPKQVPSGHEA